MRCVRHSVRSDALQEFATCTNDKSTLLALSSQCDVVICTIYSKQLAAHTSRECAHAKR
jgi:hypothetical protein